MMEYLTITRLIIRVTVPLLMISGTVSAAAINNRTKYNEYYLGYFQNAVSSDTNVSILLITNEIKPLSYIVEAPGSCGNFTVTNEGSINLPNDVIVKRINEHNKGIHVRIQSDMVTVIGQNEYDQNGDTFLALPVTRLSNNTEKFVYYAMSVGKSEPAFSSTVLIVGTQDNTSINITTTLDLEAGDINVGSRSKCRKTSGGEYHCVVDRLQTVLVKSARGDLTGIKIVTDTEVSVFSGHQASGIHESSSNEDHLVEQIPAVKFWGKEHYTAPLATRNRYSIRILAAYNFTSVDIYCNGSIRNKTIINEGNFTTKTFSRHEYCGIYSNNSVLIAQFSHTENKHGGPMMTLVPATTQYLHRLDFSTLRYGSADYQHYTTIIVMEQHFQPELIYLTAGGKNTSLNSTSWTSISVNDTQKAFVTRVNVSEGVLQIIHANTSALITAIAYGFANRIGYGHPAGIRLIDPCKPNPCGSSGICIINGNSYECVCSDSNTRVASCVTPTSPTTSITPTPSSACNVTDRLEKLQSASCSSNRLLLDLTREVVSEDERALGSLICNLTVASNRSCTSGQSSEDLMNVNTILQFTLNTLEKKPEILSDGTILNIVSIISNVSSPNNSVGWKELETMNPGQNQILLSSVERLGILLAENLNRGLTPTVMSENLIIEAMSANTSTLSDITFPNANNTYNILNSIVIPASFIRHRSISTGINPVPIVNVHYENIQNILSYGRNLTTQPVSQVLSSQVTNTSGTVDSSTVHLTFQYNLSQYSGINISTLRCGHWNFSLNEGRGDWDTEGVTVVGNYRENSTIVCSSSHLTSFAVLVDVSDGHKDISEGERRILSLISLIGCGISIACLLITIVILLYYRKTLLNAIQYFVHLNLAIALLLAFLIFVSGVERARENEVACTIVAALLHYFFTAVFSWMLSEGIMLYFLLVKVFNTGLGERRLFYFALGWDSKPIDLNGIPVPIVAITAGVAHDQYGHDEFCWIDTENGTIWAFVAPMLAIITVNVIFLMLTSISVIQNARYKIMMKTEEASQIKIVKTVLKATVILLPLLGITWVFGLLAVNQESSVFAWIFAVLNSLQGLFIFIFHIVRNDKIWKKISSCLKQKENSVTTSPSDSFKHKSKQNPQSVNTLKIDIKFESKANIIIRDSTIVTAVEKDTTPETEAKLEEGIITTSFPLNATVTNSHETDL